MLKGKSAVILQMANEFKNTVHSYSLVLSHRPNDNTLSSVYLIQNWWQGMIKRVVSNGQAFYDDIDTLE